MSTEKEHNHFTFNGESSLSFGLVISRVPSMRSPGKRIESIEIPGRSGALHQWDGSYEEYDQVYRCWFLPEAITGSLSARVHIINEWLSSAPAGAELRDSYDFLTYRRATYIGGAEIKTVGKECGVFDIKFRCDPRCFLESGRDWEVSPSNPVSIPNSTGHDAHPLLHITCAGSGTVEFQKRKGENVLKKYRIEINFPSNLGYEFTFDCATGESWGLDGDDVVSFNRWLTVAELPVIHSGQNDITVTGGVDHAQIDMRWWTL